MCSKSESCTPESRTGREIDHGKNGVPNVTKEVAYSHMVAASRLLNEGLAFCMDQLTSSLID